MSHQRTPAPIESDKPLSDRQREIVDHIMTTGQSPYQAAEALGTDPSNIYRTLRYPHVKRYLQELTLQHVGLLAPYAAKAQEQLLSSDSDHVRAAVAENILDRHLGKPIQRQHVAHQGAIKVSIDLT